MTRPLPRGADTTDTDVDRLWHHPAADETPIVRRQPKVESAAVAGMVYAVLAAINMAGSIAFGISAIGALIIPATGELNNATVANSFTFAGAVMFFIGAVLLIPAMSTRHEHPTDT